MKIAITASGNTVKSVMDQRFGRCPFFCIYDNESKEYTIHENPACEAQSGAGPMAVQFLAKLEVNKVVAAEFGGKVKSVLEDLKIQMVLMKQEDRSMEEIVALLNK